MSLAFDEDQVFDQDYLYFFADALEEVADADAELIWNLLGLEPGARGLDLGCGHGRISSRLAARGAAVTGLDRTPLFLDQARRAAAQSEFALEYVEGDMRSLPWAEPRFDAALSWFTSFGYFDDDANRAVLREVHRVLVPGGRFLLEMNNLAALLPRWQPSSVLERDGDLVIDRRRFDPVSGRSTNERTVVRDGRVRRFQFTVRMFMPTELAAWLHEAGFSSVEFFDGDGEPLTAAGQRMIAVAHR